MTTSRDRARESIAVALDTADWPTFQRWCALFGPRVGYLKVGLEAFVSWGPEAVICAGSSGRVFLDLKLHDIPNTVAGAVRAVRGLKVDLLTVHAGGGGEMLRAAVEAAEGELSLLAITVLTHLDQSSLDRLRMPGSSSERALLWAEQAADAGCGGVVSSALEVKDLRDRHAPPFLLVTPGIRPTRSVAGDQRRVATPERAIALGSDLLVIGRPITMAEDPVEAIEAILDELV